MPSTTNAILVLFFATTASNSGVFRFNPRAFRGNAIFYFYSEDMTQCLRACYEQPNCAVAQYDDGHLYKKGFCKLYKDGTIGTVGAYVLSREETDPSCVTETATSDITFQKIPRKENVTKLTCNITQDVTVIQPYDRSGGYRFFVTDTAEIADNWNATVFKLLFSKKPGKNCTGVPVFHKADYRRLYFGEIYNVSGYYFYNAYAFADYCTSAGECLGRVEMQEYVDENGDFFYDIAKSDKKNMKDSGLNQTFFIVGRIFNK